MLQLPSSVSSPPERRLLFRWLLEKGVSFHPDTAANEYVRLSDGSRIFDDKTCRMLDRLMDEAVRLDGEAYEEGSRLLRHAMQDRPKGYDAGYGWSRS